MSVVPKALRRGQRDFYLDTNAVSYFCAPGGSRSGELDRVQNLVRTGVIRIFASVAIIEELVPIAEVDRQLYMATCNQLLMLAGPHLLLPRMELCVKEMTKGKQLSFAESCCDIHLAAKVRELALTPSQHVDLADEIRERKREYIERFSPAIVHINARLADMGKDRGDLQRETRQQWTIQRTTTDDWIRSTPFAQDGLPDISPERVARMQMPVLRSWYSYTIAVGYKAIIDGTALVPSNAYDWEHYAYAAIPGTLVTDDGALRRVTDRIEQPYVRVLRTDEFVSRIRS